MRTSPRCLRAITSLLLAVLVASACASASVENTAVVLPKFADAPADDSLFDSERTILLDERTDRGNEPDEPPTIEIDSEDQTLDGDLTRGGRRDVEDENNADDSTDGATDDAESSGQDEDNEASGDNGDPEQEDELAPPSVVSLFDRESVNLSQEVEGVICNDETLERYNNISSVVAHGVEDGVLGAPCTGGVDNRLLYGWYVLNELSPKRYINRIGLLGGFVSAEQGKTTLAFVVPPEANDGVFQISINLERVDTHRTEFVLTLAHELAHVITTDADQIDREIAFEDCETTHNGHGCFVEDAYLMTWTDMFWPAGISSTVTSSETAAQQRCDANPGFLGPYAATNPQEDFAETFSAYVFGETADNDDIQAKFDWFAEQPEFVEVRNRVLDSGFGPIEDFFERCG